jgi:hypothetical protein
LSYMQFTSLKFVLSPLSSSRTHLTVKNCYLKL